MSPKNINSFVEEKFASNDTDKIPLTEKKEEEVATEDEEEIKPHSSSPSYSDVLKNNMCSSPPLSRIWKN